MKEMTPTGLPVSLANSIGSLTKDQRAKILNSLTRPEIERLEYDWRFWARPEQLPPTASQSGGAWRVALYLAGRGWGKTRTGAEIVRMWIESGSVGRVALVGPTASDVRDVMVQGESGLLNIAPPWNRPVYQSTKRRVVWPNGAYAMLFSADEPDRLRGPQHDAAWCDELCAWRYPSAWDMLMFTLRLGDDPKCVVTTTPRPIKILRDLVANPTTAIVRGSTFDNAANLAPAFIETITAKYSGTRLGRQELQAEILDDTPGALWLQTTLDAQKKDRAPDLSRVVVAVDPAVTSGEDADETGIIVCGRDSSSQAYILEDLSLRGTPDECTSGGLPTVWWWK
jgi:phage terminase large subunit-like protein